MQFPILSVIVFTPILAGLLILLIPAERKTEVRVAALAAATFALFLSIWAYFAYDIPAGGYQFVEKYTWLPALGISYHVGIDGMNAPLVLLTGVVMFTGVLISWGIDDRPREFFAFLFILATGVFGVFVTLDLFMLFFFYEIAVFPMYLLISIWGGRTRESRRGDPLCSWFVIARSALAMYFASGLNTLICRLEKAGFSVAFRFGSRLSSSASLSWGASSRSTTGAPMATLRRQRLFPCSTQVY
jgi:NADH-quinone oxidoreductase subunit M